jgi:hypothetical protein
MSYLVFLSLLELLVIIFFAVHLEDNVNVVGCDEEALSIVLSNSFFNVVVDDYFLVVCLVVFSVRG